MKQEASSHLFVYGSLKRASDHEMAKFLHHNSQCVGEASFPGQLYQIDFYPGAVYDANSLTSVRGEIFLLNEPRKVFSVLDEYEGFGEDFPQPNEFVRKIIPVKYDNSLVDCWVYLYNLPTDDLTNR